MPPNYQLAVQTEPAVKLLAKTPQTRIHKVQRGESLSVIAQRYGKTTTELQTYNKLRSTVLAVGQRIKIPGEATGTATQLAAVKPFIHKVSRGESLSVIAQRYGKTTKELQAYNKLRSTSLAVGQQIRIPGKTLSLAQLPKAAPVAPEPAQPVVHKVKRGESLSVIAQRYGTTSNELKTYNKLRSTSLAVGQQIRIPGKTLSLAQLPKAAPVAPEPAQPVVHKVSRGESLSVIAQRYGKTTKELQSYNQLRSTSLRVGQKLNIPGDATKRSSAACRG